MGIFFALLALILWGFGDFLIQRSVRRFGNWIALFYITGIGSVILFPFIFKDLFSILKDWNNIFLLFFVGILMLVAALFDFEGLRRGKIAIIEPIFSLELPIAVGLAIIFLHENISIIQYALIFFVCGGIFFVSTKNLRHLFHLHIEKGVWHAIVATVGMGLISFMFGLTARNTSPMLLNWYVSFFIFCVASGYLIYNKQWKIIKRDWQRHEILILGVGVIDTMAWVAYSYSVLYIPIAIAVGISESYIALAAMLGIMINKEKIKKHQYLGLIIAVCAAILLAILTDK